MLPSPYRLDALLNRTGKSWVIACHSRDIGVACLPFCNHYKDDRQGHMLYHDLRITLSVLIKVVRSKCVVVVVKRLKVLATCREIWTRFHHSTFILCLHAPMCGSTFCMADRNTGFVVALQMYVLHNWCAYGPAVVCGGPDP
jgi:hypothetical protein